MLVKTKSEYELEVEALGYSLDKECVTKRFLIQLDNAKPGELEVTLFRVTYHSLMLGLDLTPLREEALKTLEPKTVEDVFDRATAGFEMNYDLAETILTKVESWKAQALSLTKPVAHPIIELIAIEAVRQNNMRPLFVLSQAGEALGKSGQYVGQVTKALEKKFELVKKHESVKKIPGKHYANFYELTSPLGGM